MSTKYIPIILCRQPLDDTGQPMLLRKICGISLISILDQRLKSLESLKAPVLVMSAYEAQTAIAAQKLGWITITNNKRSLNDLIALLWLLKADYLILMDSRFPFIDTGIWKNCAVRVKEEKLSCLINPRYTGFAPLAVIKRNPALIGAIGKLISRGSNDWIEIVKNRVPHKKQGEFSFKKQLLTDCLEMDTVSSDIIRQLGELNINLKSLEEYENKEKPNHEIMLEMARERLVRLRERSNVPHKTNARLIRFESGNHFKRVRSFPYDVAFTITNRCNAHCLFCDYHPSHSKTSDSRCSS